MNCNSYNILFLIVCISLAAETAQLDDGPELFQNQLEDREQGEFVDYGWSNVGSFDDLDRIFRY